MTPSQGSPVIQTGLQSEQASIHQSVLARIVKAGNAPHAIVLWAAAVSLQSRWIEIRKLARDTLDFCLQLSIVLGGVNGCKSGAELGYSRSSGLGGGNFRFGGCCGAPLRLCACHAAGSAQVMAQAALCEEAQIWAANNRRIHKHS